MADRSEQAGARVPAGAAKFIIFNTQFLVFDTKFFVLNYKIYHFSSLGGVAHADRKDILRSTAGWEELLRHIVPAIRERELSITSMCIQKTAFKTYEKLVYP